MLSVFKFLKFSSFLVVFTFFFVKHGFMKLTIMCWHQGNKIKYKRNEVPWTLVVGFTYHFFLLLMPCHLEEVVNLLDIFFRAIPLTWWFILLYRIPSEKLALGMWGFQHLSVFLITRVRKEERDEVAVRVFRVWWGALWHRSFGVVARLKAKCFELSGSWRSPIVIPHLKDSFR